MNFKKVLVGGLIVIFLFGVIGCTLFAKKAAIVNGEPILMKDVEEQLSRIASQHKTAAQKKAFAQQKKQIQRQILDVLIEQTLYRQEAEKMGIKVTDKEVEEEINRTKKRFPSEAEFKKALKDAQMTLDDLRKFTRNRLITERVNRKIVGKIKVTDKEARDYYEKNKEQFKQPEQVKVSHILLKSEKKANEVLKEIQGGLDFTEAAKKYSTDPASKTRGGDLGYVQRGVMAPEFDEVAFKLKPGEIGGPVKTQFGYHLIKVFEKKEASQKTFEESKASIIQMLKAQKESNKIRKWLDKVKKKAKIKILI